MRLRARPEGPSPPGRTGRPAFRVWSPAQRNQELGTGNPATAAAHLHIQANNQQTVKPNNTVNESAAEALHGVHNARTESNPKWHRTQGKKIKPSLNNTKLPRRRFKESLDCPHFFRLSKILHDQVHVGPLLLVAMHSATNKKRRREIFNINP